MLSLRSEDIQILKEVAENLTDNPEQENQVFQNLKRGYEEFASEEMIEGSSNRRLFFVENSIKLLERLPYAGKTLVEALEGGLRDHLKNILTRLGVLPKDVEDLASEAVLKFFKHNYVEKYNPLRAGWAHYLRIALIRLRATDYGKKSRNLVHKAVSIHANEVKSQNRMEMNHDPYEIDQGGSVEDRLYLKEILANFEQYLDRQGKKRSGKFNHHTELCTLIPLPAHLGKYYISRQDEISKPVDAFLIRRGKTRSHRVETLDGRRILWPKEFVLNIRKNEILQDETLQTRSLLDLYHLVMDRGAQIEEIASKLKIGNSTAHSWMTGELGLEHHFRIWWAQSERIPEAHKWMANPVKVCPHCKYEHPETPEVCTIKGIRIEIRGKLHWVSPDLFPEANKGNKKIVMKSAQWCDLCYSWALDEIPESYSIPYPWGQVRGTHDLIEKSSKYQKGLIIQLCGL